MNIYWQIASNIDDKALMRVYIEDENVASNIDNTCTDNIVHNDPWSLSLPLTTHPLHDEALFRSMSPTRKQSKQWTNRALNLSLYTTEKNSQGQGSHLFSRLKTNFVGTTVASWVFQAIGCCVKPFLKVRWCVSFIASQNAVLVDDVLSWCFHSLFTSC